MTKPSERENPLDAAAADSDHVNLTDYLTRTQKLFKAEIDQKLRDVREDVEKLVREKLDRYRSEDEIQRRQIETAFVEKLDRLEEDWRRKTEAFFTRRMKEAAARDHAPEEPDVEAFRKHQEALKKILEQGERIHAASDERRAAEEEEAQKESLRRASEEHRRHQEKLRREEKERQMRDIAQRQERAVPLDALIASEELGHFLDRCVELLHEPGMLERCREHLTFEATRRLFREIMAVGETLDGERGAREVLASGALALCNLYTEAFLRQPLPAEGENR